MSFAEEKSPEDRWTMKVERILVKYPFLVVVELVEDRQW